MKILVVIMLALLIPTADAQSITINSTNQTNQMFSIRPPFCITDNSTGNSYCADYPNFNLTLTLNYSQTYTNSTINISVTSPPNSTAVVTNTIYNATCIVYRNLTLGETLIQKGFGCDIEVTAPPDAGKEIITETITPTFANETKFFKQTERCDIDITVNPCPGVKIEIPENLTFIEKNRKDKLEFCADILPGINFSKLECEDKLKSTADKVCSIPDDKLLIGFEKLPAYQKKFLERFVQYQYPVTPFEFTENWLREQNISRDEFEDEWLFIQHSLNKFSDLEFARTGSKQVYLPEIQQFKNETTYEPIIETGCVKKITGLSVIKSAGWKDGATQFGFIFISIIGVSLIFYAILGRISPVPSR